MGKFLAVAVFCIVCQAGEAQSELVSSWTRAEKWLSIDGGATALFKNSLFDEKLNPVAVQVSVSNHYLAFWNYYNLGLYEQTYFTMGNSEIVNDIPSVVSLRYQMGLILGPVYKIKHNYSHTTYYALGIDVKWVHGMYDVHYGATTIQYMYDSFTFGVAVDIGWRFAFNEYITMNVGAQFGFDILSLGKINRVSAAQNYKINYGWITARPYVGIGITWITEKSYNLSFGNDEYWVD
jgi:hypothetical protein